MKLICYNKQTRSDSMKRFVCFLCACFVCLTLLPVHAQAEVSLYSNFAYVVNMDNQEVLYEKQSEVRMYPASMTKIMTVFTALEHLDAMDETITITDAMLAGLQEESASVVGFQSGEEVKIIDLLYGIMLVSGADACRAIAFHIAGSEEAFVELMNAKVKDMQLTNTHFVNTSGLHNDEHYTTAKEMAIILQEALKSEMFYTIFTTNVYSIEASTYQSDSFYLQSTKTMQAREAGLDIGMIVGAKTGFTLEGGLCLASIATIADTHYLMISAQAGNQVYNPLHLQDAITMYDYLAQTYSTRTFYKQGDAIQSVAVRYGDIEEVAISSEEDIKAWGNLTASFREEIVMDTPVAPIAKGDSVGEINIYEEDTLIATYSLISTQDISFSFLAFLRAHIIGIFILLALFSSIVIIRYRRNRKSY